MVKIRSCQRQIVDAYLHRTRRLALRQIIVVCTLFVLLVASAAQAQRKKITLDDLVIEGNIQKPEAFFILPRSNLNVADLQRREDLKAKIIEAVSHAPF
jgi:hypothetical protein